MLHTCAGNVLEVVIGGLEPEAQYQFQVAAYTRKGDGERSRPKKIRTKGAGTDSRCCSEKQTVLLTLLTITQQVMWLPK